MSQAQAQPAAPGAGKKSPLLQVTDLRVHFPVRKGLMRRAAGYVKAVDGVSFDLAQGQTLGLVGESGCGKTTVGRAILRLIPATGGQVVFDGTDVFAAPPEKMRQLRRSMQIIFQDPIGSLNPRMTIGRILAEPLEVHGLARGSELQDRVAELMKCVGLDVDFTRRYPHEFSGGQRQRIGIARALALKPRFIICDEPVSALDVSIQSQILNLLDDLQDQFSLSYLFIAHNLSVVRHFSDRVAVMYLGRMVEIGDVRKNEPPRLPYHPYAQALLSAAPEPDPRAARRRIVLPGEVPSPVSPPVGCTFHPRCLLSRQLAASASDSQTIAITVAGQPVRLMQKCLEEVPVLRHPAGASEEVRCACHYAEEVPAHAV